MAHHPVSAKTSKNGEKHRPYFSCMMKREMLAVGSSRHESENDAIERQHLKKVQLERFQAADERLEEQAQRYEAKITELHSVIAELSKKIEQKRINYVIKEEDEEEELKEIASDVSSSRGSSNNNNANQSTSEDEMNVDLSRVIVALESDCKPRRQRKKRSKENVVVEAMRTLNEDEEELTEVPNGDLLLQVTELQEEVVLLRAENQALHSQIGHQETELNKTKAALGSLREERDRLRRKVREIHAKLQSFQSSHGSQGSGTGSPTRSRGSNVECGSPTHRGDDATPVTKLAERVKLKRGVESAPGSSLLLGPQISSSLGVSSTKVVEHLVHQLQEESNTQEIFQAVCSSGSQIPEGRVREFEVETERLHSKIENLRSQNDLMALSLEESKSQCDRLSVLIGKYESNNTALQLALSYDDQIIDAYALLLTVLESKCLNQGEGNDDEKVKTTPKRENRKLVESAAKRFLLLHRLDKRGGQNMEKPWDDLSSHSHTASTTSSSSSYGDELSKLMDENKLRELISALKNERSLVKTTITELESVHIDPVTREPSTSADAHKLDLENAVLMQELMAIKEEKAELKAQVYLLERERASLELKLSGRDVQEQAYIAHIEQLKSEVKDQHNNENQRSGGWGEWYAEGHSAVMEDPSEDLSQNLVEALHREKKLKTRIQELVSTLEKVSRNSELRHQQSLDFVNDLKRANSALISAFEKSKRKYQSKIKKLEQQAANQSEKHAAQIRLFREKIISLEDQLTSQNLQSANETSL